MRSHLLGGFPLGLAVAARYNAAFMVFLWIGGDVLTRGAPWKLKVPG